MSQDDSKVPKSSGDEKAVNEKRYLRPKEIAAYALTSYGQDNLSGFVNNTKGYFMMNYFEMSGDSYAKMRMFSSIWDALDDPLSGIIIDRCRTRWGRLRPFMLFPIPLWAITSMLYFVTPAWAKAQILKLVYGTTVNIINGIGFSYFGAWGLLLYNLTPNLNERNNLLATQKFVNLFSWLPSLVKVGVDFIPKLTNFAVNQHQIYFSASFLFTLFAVVTAIYGFLNMRERVPLLSRSEMKEANIWKSIMLIVRNRPLYALLLSTFFGSVKGVGGVSEDFFWLNCTGKLSNGFLASLFTGIPNYIITPMAPKVVKKFGVRPTAMTSGIFGGTLYTLLYILGYSPTKNKSLNFVILTVMLTFAGLPNHFMSFCGPILTGDMYDYLEWKSGFRSEGLVNAVSGYITKLSDSIIGYLQGAVFEWIHFTPMKDGYGNIIPHTDQKILKGIFGIFCLAPAVSRFGYSAALLLFNVHGKFKTQMQIDLNKRRLDRVEKASSAAADNAEIES